MRTVGSNEPAGLTTARLEAFSDGVIAIAVTLLVLELKRPDPGQTVWAALGHERGLVAGFVVSFATIGIFWVNHHALFHHVRQVDRTLLFLNLFALGAITILPYTTGGLGGIGGIGGEGATGAAVTRAAAVLYCLSLGVAASSFTVIRAYLHQHRDLLEPAARSGSGPALRRSLVGPIGYCGATALAFASPVAALVACAALAAYFVGWVGVRR